MTEPQVATSTSTEINFTDEHRAYLTFVGDFEPDSISNELAISPTRSYVKGELRPRTEQPYKVSRWSLESRLPRTEPGNKHVKDVLEQIRPEKQRIRELRDMYEGWLQLVGYFECQGGFDIDACDIAELAEMNLSLDFDLYMIGSGKE